MKALAKILLILVIAVSLGASLTILLGSLYVSRYKDSQVDPALLEINQRSGKTEFYRFDFDETNKRQGNAELIKNSSLDSGIKYEFVQYSEIPSDLINAFIAIEDKRFYDHKGIDPIRTSGAVVNYIFSSGHFGGSTITQQLVKNLTGHAEFSVNRKLNEAFSAIDLEKKYDKTELLEMYLNIINLSEGCRGVGAASEYFYSKKVSKLTLSECATIAAITNNPAKYDPQKHPESNLKRRNAVLKCMLEQKYITEEEYRSAINEPITLNISSKYTDEKVNSWYIDMVTEDVIVDLCKKYKVTKDTASFILYSGGFKIYTAMNEKIQHILDEYYGNEYNFPIDKLGNLPQSSMIIIDPYTGDILGVAGAIGKKTGNRLLNYATGTKRPTGSAIKPLSVYAPALEEDLIQWSTIVEDSPIIPATDKQKAWPLNASNSYAGNVDIKYAVENSLNTVPIKVLKLLGEKRSFDFLKNKLRIYNLNADYDMGAASLALGQHSYGISLRELTAAYSIFEEGIMSRARSYYKVTDSYGRVILDNSSEQEAVISQETAAIMTKLLESVVDSGTASGIISLDKIIDVAGKTGTTQNSCDRYFIGYTPEILAGVWFGYDYPKNLSEFGGNVSAYIWDDIMTEIYKEQDFGKKTRFSVPQTVQMLSYDAESGEFISDATTKHAVGWFADHHNIDQTLINCVD